MFYNVAIESNFQILIRGIRSTLSIFKSAIIAKILNRSYRFTLILINIEYNIIIIHIINLTNYKSK